MTVFPPDAILLGHLLLGLRYHLLKLCFTSKVMLRSDYFSGILLF